MISGANDKELELATARANIIMALDNTSTYESWLMVDTYIEKLEDNWNKLKEWLEERIKYYKDIGYINTSIAFEFVLEKLQEIEGGMNE